MTHPFNDEDLLVILESAHQALRSPEIFNNLADCLDINDEELQRIRESLREFLDDRAQPAYLKTT